MTLFVQTSHFLHHHRTSQKVRLHLKITSHPQMFIWRKCEFSVFTCFSFKGVCQARADPVFDAASAWIWLMVADRTVPSPRNFLNMCADEAKLFFLSCQWRGTQSSSPKAFQIESYKLLSFITTQPTQGFNLIFFHLSFPSLSFIFALSLSGG